MPSSPPTAPASLELRDLTKSYVRGGTPALNAVSHAFAPGQVTVVLGPSGSGKSTVLGAISGLVPPDAGGVWLDGRDITGLPPERRGFGMVFQNYALFPHLSVAENVEFGLRVRGLGREERRAQALEMLHLTRIPHLAQRRVHEISGGEQQRVAVARALAVRPTVLLMDEPLSALDARLRDDLRAELARLLRDLALTTVYVTHDQAEAMSLGHALLVMRGGRIEQAGRAEDLYLRPASPFVAGFIGAANVFTGVERLADGTVRLPFAQLPTETDAPAGPCWAMLRPESFEIVRDGGRADFTAVVESVFFLGAQLRAQLRLGEQPLTAEFPAGTPLQPGRPLALRVRPGGLYVRAAERAA